MMRTDTVRIDRYSSGMITANATMSFSNWDEDPPSGDDAPLPRLAQALAAFGYEGDLDANSTCRYTLSYGPDGQGTAVGFEAVEGSLGGRTGGFVLRHEASFTASEVEISFTIVPGSGTADLTGISGSGAVTAILGSQDSAWSLSYELA